jgi:hypothetical protein
MKQGRPIPLLSLRAYVACKKGETYLPNIKNLGGGAEQMFLENVKRCLANPT